MQSTKIVTLHVMSDLHMGNSPFQAPETAADIVILAGDISRPKQAISWAQGFKQPVIYVPGNHEFYGGSLEGTLHELKTLTQGSHIHVLDNESITLHGIRFLGSTLWSTFNLFPEPDTKSRAIEQALELVRDFSVIKSDTHTGKPFSPDLMNALYERNRAWLKQALDTRCPEPTVVITHHAPSLRSVNPRFKGSLLNACFASETDDLVQGDKAVLWIHGHMHDCLDYTLNGTRVVCNPRGYFRDGIPENPAFNPAFTVSVVTDH